MIQLNTHGEVLVRSGRALLQADYSSGDGAPGVLSLRLEDQETFDAVDGRLRLDPWSGDVYEMFDWTAGDCFVICGAQAVVALKASTLAIVSSVAMEYEEGETIEAPWFSEAHEHHALIIATERRVWCLDDRATIRWMWSCATAEYERWILNPPEVADGRVRISLGTDHRDISIELSIIDGLQACDSASRSWA